MSEVVPVQALGNSYIQGPIMAKTARIHRRASSRDDASVGATTHRAVARFLRTAASATLCLQAPRFP